MALNNGAKIMALQKRAGEAAEGVKRAVEANESLH